MIRVEKPKKPQDFDSLCRQRGLTWLVEHPNATRPYDYWTPFKPALRAAFGQRCAYMAMYEPFGTIDHFVSVSEDISKAYEWDNFRFASGFMNQSKLQLKSSEILDPFEIGDGWFEIILPSLQMIVTNKVPLALRDKALFTISRFHLIEDERVIELRQEWYELYLSGDITLSGLSKVAPLIAAAIKKHVPAQ